MGKCPVHGSTDSESLNFYPDGYERKAFWQCWSHHCEGHFKGNLLGFVRGVLSHQEYGWEKPKDREVTWRAAVNFLCDFLGTDWNKLKPDYTLAQTQQFLAGVAMLAPQTTPNQKMTTKNQLRDKLEIPAKYYTDRGFQPTTLDAYDVGLCVDPTHELYGRVVIPFYNQEKTAVIGCIGRSPFEECPQCQTYHDPLTPCLTDDSKIVDYCKVKTSRGFNDKNFLYNYWNAHQDILATRCVHVVEGAADVWRLVEAGIHNCVAISGSGITSRQQIALECSGATEIICLTDDDEAGEKAYENIADRCWFAKTTRPDWWGFKDIAEMKVEQIKNWKFYMHQMWNYRHTYGENHPSVKAWENT